MSQVFTRNVSQSNGPYFLLGLPTESTHLLAVAVAAFEPIRVVAAAPLGEEEDAQKLPQASLKAVLSLRSVLVLDWQWV